MIQEGITYYKPPFNATKSKYLVINDIHIPYHNKQSVNLALERLKDCEGLIINGDMLDFHNFSNFVKRPDAPTIIAELDVANELFSTIRAKFSGEIIYKLGNHERRLATYIMSRAAALFGLENVLLKDKLDFKKYKVKVVDYAQIIKFGDLNIIHGHEIRAVTSLINVARTYFLKAQANVMLGHYHVSQDYIVRGINQKIKGGWAVGCLCDLSPEYNPINQWVHGFAVITKDKNSFEVENKKIINGKIR